MVESNAANLNGTVANETVIDKCIFCALGSVGVVFPVRSSPSVGSKAGERAVNIGEDCAPWVLVQNSLGRVSKDKA